MTEKMNRAHCAEAAYFARAYAISKELFEKVALKH